jgi:hypothetical protein
LGFEKSTQAQFSPGVGFVPAASDRELFRFGHRAPSDRDNQTHSAICDPQSDYLSNERRLPETNNAELMQIPDDAWTLETGIPLIRVTLRTRIHDHRAEAVQMFKTFPDNRIHG